MTNYGHFGGRNFFSSLFMGLRTFHQLELRETGQLQ